MNPSRSMRNPLPEPWRGASRSRGGTAPPPPPSRWKRVPGSRGSPPLDVDSMLTTAAFIRSATSAKLTTIGAPVTAARAGSLAGGSVRGAVETIGAGVNAPAMISPTRKATTAESATVRSVKRFDIDVLVKYKRLQLVFGQNGDPKVLRLFELTPRIRADDDARGLPAHRASDLAAQPLDRGNGFLARHRLESAGQ